VLPPIQDCIKIPAELPKPKEAVLELLSPTDKLSSPFIWFILAVLELVFVYFKT